jgi:hypothetical protein
MLSRSASSATLNQRIVKIASLVTVADAKGKGIDQGEMVRYLSETVHRRQNGFKAHVAVEPDSGIVTDCALTKTTGANNRGGGGRGAAARARATGTAGARRLRVWHWGCPRRARRGRPPGGDQAAAAAIGGAGGYTVDDSLSTSGRARRPAPPG